MGRTDRRAALAALGVGMLYMTCSAVALFAILEPAGLPLLAYVGVGIACGLFAGIGEWRSLTKVPLRVVDSAPLHSLCRTCWDRVEPSRSPPQLAMNQRMVETCCRCGRRAFDGIFSHSHDAYAHCAHEE